LYNVEEFKVLLAFRLFPTEKGGRITVQGEDFEALQGVLG